MLPFAAKEAFYIKLGSGGKWVNDAFNDGVLRFGYNETPHELCVSGQWDKVRDFWLGLRKDAGAASRDSKQIRIFYEANEQDIFITFHHGLMYWCRPTGSVEVMKDGSRRRATVSGWSSKSLNGISLSADRLSGHLLKVQMYQGTICNVGPFEYLLRKLNDSLLPELDAAEKAEAALASAVIGLMKLLTWKDFELLVDLVFSTSGWRRIGKTGGPQQTIDLDLVLPSTEERAFVQIKSEANSSSLSNYIERFEEADFYDRMFFVYHTGSVVQDITNDKITLIGPDRLAAMVINAGLVSWLKAKIL